MVNICKHSLGSATLAIATVTVCLCQHGLIITRMVQLPATAAIEYVAAC